MANIDATYQTVLEIVHKAGVYARYQWNSSGQSGPTVIETKENYADLLTETDGTVEKMLISHLSKHYPDHCFIGEESIGDGNKVNFTDKPTWIIDPIDGTCNFVHKHPYFAISIGYYVNKLPQIGIIYNVPEDKLYSAIKGRGAFCNGQLIKPSNQNDLKRALLMCEFGSQRDEEFAKFKIDNMSRLLPNSHGIRCLGAAALNIVSVASGEADAYLEHGLHIWDMAAGYLIAAEAGCVVIDPTGEALDLRSRRILVSSTEQLANQIRSLINPVFEGIELD